MHRSFFLLWHLALFVGVIGFCSLRATAGPAHSELPGVAAPFVSEGHELRVVPAAPGKHARVVVKLPQGGVLDFELSRDALQVEKLWVIRDRLVAVSQVMGGGASEVASFDLATGRVVDVFLGYGLAVSPDGRRLAFQRFYPAHFARGTESQYRLYDVLASPAANRPSYKKGAPPQPTAQRLAEMDKTDPVGMAVYPLSARELGRPNVELPARHAHHGVSAMAWSPDGRELAFLDRVGGQTSLVLVDTSADIEPGRVPARFARLTHLDRPCNARSQDGCMSEPTDLFQLQFEGDAIVARAASGERAETVRVSRHRLKPVPQARYGDQAD